MYNQLIITAPHAGLDSLVVTCWPATTVLATSVATPHLPFSLAARLLGEERIVPILQRCLLANPRTPEQEDILYWFWRQFQPLVRQEVGAFRHRIGCSADLDDFCQETWGEVWHTLPMLPYDLRWGRLSGWMIVVARRTVQRIGRRLLRLDTPHDIDELPPLVASDLGPEDEYRLNELRSEIETVLCKLRRQTSWLNYEVFCQRFFEHQSVEKIAAELVLTPKAVQRRYDRVMRRFGKLARHVDLLELGDCTPPQRKPR